MRSGWLSGMAMFDRRSALFAVTCLFSVMLTSATSVEAGSSGAGLRVFAQPMAVAAGKSQSSQFGLNSCIDPVMTGVSSNYRYRVVSGCGALQETLHIPAGIPVNGALPMILLALALVSSAAYYLRPGGSHAS